MEAKEKIDILLVEYTSLRSWVFARLGHSFQFLTIVPATLALIVGSGYGAGPIAVFLISFLLIAIFAALWAYTDVQLAGRRLQELELEINEIAGEPLLKWESTLGGRLTRRRNRS